MATETTRTMDAVRYGTPEAVNYQRGTEYRVAAFGATPKAINVATSGQRACVQTVSGWTDGSAIAMPRVRIGAATIAWAVHLPAATADFHYSFNPPIFSETNMSVIAELSAGTGGITMVGFEELVL